jgi:hypothetical protein
MLLYKISEINSVNSLENEILTFKNMEIFTRVVMKKNSFWKLVQEHVVKLYTPVSVQLICVNLRFLA